MARQLILIRHATVPAAYVGRYLGRTDVPLDRRGQDQARALAAALGDAGAAACWCSPLARARQTTELALPGAATPPRIEPDLREIDFGVWENRTFEEIHAADPAAVDRWAALAPDFTFPQGERLAGFVQRIGAVAQRLAADPADTLLAVTHGGVIRTLLCRLLGLDVRHYLAFRVDYASITRLELFDGQAVLTGLNDRHHLEGL
jgi:alpha-ribazole phosphatase